MTNSIANDTNVNAPVRIVGARNPVNQVPFELELADGEICAFTLPKVQYIPKPIMDAYEPWLLEWQIKASAVGKNGAKAREKMRDTDAILKLLEMLLPPEMYANVAGLTRGELLDINTQWGDRSDAVLGESGASAVS